MSTTSRLAESPAAGRRNGTGKAASTLQERQIDRGLVQEQEGIPPREMFPVLRHLWAENRYCLRVVDDRMAPTLQVDDVILIEHKPGTDPESVNGRVCACLVDGKGMIRRLYVERRDGVRRIILRGDNPDTDPVLVYGSDDFRVQGIVLKVVSRKL